MSWWNKIVFVLDVWMTRTLCISEAYGLMNMVFICCWRKCYFFYIGHFTDSAGQGTGPACLDYALPRKLGLADPCGPNLVFYDFVLVSLKAILEWFSPGITYNSLFTPKTGPVGNNWFGFPVGCGGDTACSLVSKGTKHNLRVYDASLQ